MPTPRRHPATTLIALLALLPALATPQAPHNPRLQPPLKLEITFQPGKGTLPNAVHLANADPTLAWRALQNPRPDVWLFAVPELQNAARAIRFAQSRRSVAAARPLAPELPQDLVKSTTLAELETIISHYKTTYTTYKALANLEESDEYKPKEDYEGAEVDEVPGLDFLEAYLLHKQLRAYPNQEIDLTPYLEVARQRFDQLEGRAVGDPRLTTPAGTAFEGSQPVVPANNPLAWQFLGPTNLAIPYRIYYGLSPINGRANALAFHPTEPDTFFIAGAQGGVWKSTDAGANWTVLTDNWPLLGVSSLAIHPTDGNLVLAGTGDFFGFDVAGIGVMRSTDGGQSWTRTGGVMGAASISRIQFQPGDPTRVFAVGGRSGGHGLWRSTDAGATWTTVRADFAFSDLDFGAPDPENVSALWVAAGGANARVLLSQDNGATFANVTPAGVVGSNQNPLAIAASKHFPGTAYVLATTPRRIFKTTDFGATWADVTTGFPNGSNNYNWSQGWYDYHIYCAPITVAGQPRDAVYVGLIDLVLSVNGGQTWRSAGGANWSATYTNNAITHNDQHNLAVDPNNPNRVLVGNDGGVYLATYAPANDTFAYQRLSRNLGITQFYSLAVHPTNPDYVKGGTQDNATPHSFGNLASWGNPGAGDGAGCAINPLNPNIQYNSSQFHGLVRTTNAYASRNNFAPNFGSDSVPFIGKLWLDPNNPRYVYVNTNFLWRWDEQTTTWTPRLGNQRLATSGRVNAFAVANGDSNILYTGATNGEVWVSRDFGATWRRIDRQGQSGGLPNRSVTSISPDPDNSDDILVTLGGSGAAHVYRCANTSAANPTWTPVDGSGQNTLPNLIANFLARDPRLPASTWYVATDVGVYRTTDAGATFRDITQPLGLPNVQVNELAANPNTGYLTAATYGRGIWRLDIAPGRLTSLQAPAEAVSGDPVPLTIAIDRPAPAGGVLVPLTSSSAADLAIPPSALVPEGQTSVVVPATSRPRTTNLTVNVTANLFRAESKPVTLLGLTEFGVSRFSPSNAGQTQGGLTSLVTSDDNRLTWTIAQPRRGETTLYTFARSPFANASIGRVEIEIAASIPGVEARVLAYDYDLRSYVSLATTIVGPTDTRLSVPITGDLSRFFRNNQSMQIAVSLEHPDQLPFQAALDLLRFRLRQ